MWPNVRSCYGQLALYYKPKRVSKPIRSIGPAIPKNRTLSEIFAITGIYGYNFKNHGVISMNSLQWYLGKFRPEITWNINIKGIQFRPVVFYFVFCLANKYDRKSSELIIRCATGARGRSPDRKTEMIRPRINDSRSCYRLIGVLHEVEFWSNLAHFYRMEAPGCSR